MAALLNYAFTPSSVCSADSFPSHPAGVPLRSREALKIYIQVRKYER